MLPTSTEQSAAAKKAPSGSKRYPYGKPLDKDSDYVKFTFYDYTAPFGTDGASGPGIVDGTATINNYNKSSSTGLKPTGMSILMYMPEDINADYGASWTDTNLSTIAGGGLKSFGKFAGGDMAGTFDAALGGISTGIGNALTKGTAAANVLSGALGQANLGSLSVNDIFAAATGQILNPNTEVLYKGPKMRNFSLGFKMAPRDGPEAKEIKEIIHAFKYATLPTYGSAGDKSNASFIKVPQIVDVTFMRGGKENEWVTQFKPCVITSFDISQTPDGAWSTYTDGSPVATTMKISFQETKMVYADELSDSGATF